MTIKKKNHAVSYNLTIRLNSLYDYNLLKQCMEMSTSIKIYLIRICMRLNLQCKCNK